MSIKLPPKLPDPNFQWIDTKTGKPTPEAFKYFSELDLAVRRLIAVVNVLSP